MNYAKARIGLGAVQWGTAYGVANKNGKTTPEEVSRILASARLNGIQVIDTAALYGDSETVLGMQDLNNFLIVTKTPRFLRTKITTADADELKETLSRSLSRLRISSVYGLLVHHADDLFVPGGERIIDMLNSMRDEGKVVRIGVSVYDGLQLEALLEKFTPDLVQLPLSVFDQRLINDGSINRLAARGIEIHTRSALLQGLLLMNPDTIPDYFSPWRDQLREWHFACADQNVLPQHAALSFVCDQPAISCCLVGVQNSDQLTQLLSGLENVVTRDISQFASNDLGLINPVNWRIS